MADTIIVVGGGGHSKVVVSTVTELGIDIQGIYDDDPNKQGVRIGNAAIIGTISGIDGSKKAVIGIGDNRTRAEMDRRLKNCQWVTAIHPRAYVHPSVSVGEGTVIFAGAVIQPGTVIGRHCIVNTNAAIDHDCVIGDYSHVGPGASLAGNVTVGEGAFLGVGAVAVMGAAIGAWSIVGAGAAVIKDIPGNVTAVGVPARIVKKS
jgi:sugar O-acyltransferase (sialic acid O-acetyltransferase NeuD family)